MKSDIRSAQAFQIIHVLAELPGSAAINLTARKFPRFGPHETGTIFEEKSMSFAVNQLPEAVEVPADAEDVRITVSGALQQGSSPNLVGQLNQFFAQNGMSDRWEVRGWVQPAPSANGRTYQVQVFM
jgi:hypothetical protein